MVEIDRHRRIAEVMAQRPRAAQLAGLAALGATFLGEDDLEGALACFDQALRLDPHRAAAWVGRGEVLARKNRAGEALGCVQRALEREPDHLPALLLKAKVLVQVGSRPEALACYDDAVQAKPNVAELWIDRARLLAELGRPADATTSLDRALTLEDSAEVWATRGDLMAKLGRDREADASYARSLELDPERSELWYRLGLARAKMRDSDGARAALERFVELATEADPLLSAAQSLLFQMDRYSGKPHPAPAARAAPPRRLTPGGRPAATVRTTPAPRLPTPPPEKPTSSPEKQAPGKPPLARAEDLFEEGKHLDALRQIEPVVTREPNNVPAWILRARLLLALGQREIAAKSLAEATERDPRNGAAWKLTAKCFVAMKKFDRALDAAECAYALAPTDPEVHRVRGDCLLAASRHLEAVYAYEKAIHHAPKDADAWLALGRVLQVLRRCEAARAALETARNLGEARGRPDVATEARDLLHRIG